ncbi:MAG: hypothetical protein ABIX01_00615 [Chitinophagaceae bacterium]
MRKSFFFVSVAASLLFASCKGKSGGDQSTPEGVAEIIFNSARTGEFAPLKSLCNDAVDTDGDSKKVCEVATDKESQKQFVEYFSRGKVNGVASVEGDKAAVKIFFGPEGTKEETLNMVKKDDKWYLASF